MRERQTPFDSMEQLFDQMRREILSGRRSTPAIESAETAGWDAGFSIEETGDGFVVLADLPGYDREELTVRLHDDHLHLDGEHEVGEGASYRSRRVSEQVRLPAAVDPEHVTATYHNGVLEVTCVVEADDEAGTEIDVE
jgi:HSP20 family protein